MRALVPLAAGVLLLAGCTAAVQSGEPETPSPFLACAAASGAVGAGAGVGADASAAAAPGTGASAATASGAPGGVAASGTAASAAAASGTAAVAGLTDLPAISVACFAGGDPVNLRTLRGPAVINVWASSCGPCREELPLIQKLADRTAGKLTVLGLDTGDSRAAAASFGSDHGVTLPTLYDPDRTAITELKVVNLPTTIFVDASGKSYLHRYAMDATDLTQLLREHAGLSVTL
ncbi:TlpA family protein disulfide reductase [Actinoplanes sp. NPDC020271]|uniref:TlpA family protein disulfide reductase n=1 Tax=Actinoplanes sp. NPDC020271 TaxID=3363896 RepID=UPI003798763D